MKFMKHERRFNAGGVYRRPKGHYEISAKADVIALVLMAITVGALMGATLDRMVMGACKPAIVEVHEEHRGGE